MLFKKLIPAILWALFILGLCVLPGTAIPELTFLEWLKPDKLIHLFLFGVLAFLLIKGFTGQLTSPFLRLHAKVISIFLSAFYGVVVEIIQEYCVSGRHGDVYDSIADAIGAFLGLWYYNYRIRRSMAGGAG
jgi:hypothetical protein